MIERNISKELRKLAQLYPVVTVIGPRQAGKTILCRSTFPKMPYVTLEPLDVRDAVRRDPRGFLGAHPAGVVIDEVQHVPELPSYIQAEVDVRSEPGRFILTGSQHLGLTGRVSQSLAGRTGMLVLLPPALDELRRFASPPRDLLETLWAGAYPRIHDRGIPPDRWLADYVTTYVERDVRDVLRIGDLQSFTRFVRLCAGRTAQEINLSALGGDAGVSHNTARAWLSVLEASFLCFRAPAWRRNVRKQMIKAAKLHFFDSGLACHLLGIREVDHLRTHPLRGAVFESWVVAEVYKARSNAGLAADLFHYRDAKRLEVDLVLESGDALVLVEAKSGATVDPEFIEPLDGLDASLPRRGQWRSIERCLIHGGDADGRLGEARLLPWHQIDRGPWTPT